MFDIAGTVHSSGDMTIDHSDVKVVKPDVEDEDLSPYRVWSEAGIELINEKNGEVKDGKLGDKDVRYVDTDDGEDVDLKADGEPAYYRCKGDNGTDSDDGAASDDSQKRTTLPATSDGQGAAVVALVLVGGAALHMSRKLRGKTA